MQKNMVKYLEKYSPPVLWNFTPKQLQDADKVIKYMKEKYCSYSKEAQLTTLCWTLASIYQTLLSIMQHLQGKGRGNRQTGAVAKLCCRIAFAQGPECTW